MTPFAGLLLFLIGLLTGASITALVVAYFVYRTLEDDAKEAQQRQQMQKPTDPWWMQDVTDNALVVQGYEEVKQ